MLLKSIWGENSHLFAYLHICAFARVSLCLSMLLVLLVLFSAFSVCQKFSKKKKKKFKTALITSFILLLKGGSGTGVFL